MTSKNSMQHMLDKYINAYSAMLRTQMKNYPVYLLNIENAAFARTSGSFWSKKFVT